MVVPAPVLAAPESAPGAPAATSTIAWPARGRLVVATICTADAMFDIAGGSECPGADGTGDEWRTETARDAGVELALSVAAAVAGRGPVDTGLHSTREGGPVEAALRAAAGAAGIARPDVTRELPELEARRSSAAPLWRATFHRRRSGRIAAFVAGPAGDVLARCWCVFAKGQSRPLDPQTRQRLQAAERTMHAEGLQVIALATGDVTRASEHALTGLTFVALAGLCTAPVPGKAGP